MNKRQIDDAYDCEVQASLGETKSCVGCSCNVCLAQQPKVFTPNEYQKLALRTATNVDDKDLCIQEGALGLSGEAGEVADLIKKWMFQGHDMDKEKLIRELGDVCWYISLIALGVGGSLEEILKTNIDKLKDRYPDGFDPKRSKFRGQ